MTSIDILVFDGLDEMDALGPLEVFRSAERAGADLTTRLVTARPQQIVTGAYGLRFEPDGVLVPGEADVFLVPGGGWAARAEVGAWGEYRRGSILPLIADAAAKARIVAAVCTGSMLLAHAGVIGGRPAATHHLAHDELRATGAQLVDERVVDDGDLVTSGGVTSGIDLALWLVERECSTALAADVARRMEYTVRR